MGRFSVCEFGAHGGESPETRAPGLFGLRGDAQPRPVSHLSAPAPAQLCRRWPGFTVSSAQALRSGRLSAYRCPMLNTEGCPWLPGQPTTLTVYSVTYFLLKHASNDIGFVLVYFFSFFPLRSSMSFNKGFLWSKPPSPHPKQKQHNTSQSQLVLSSICAPGLMLSGCLPASCWGMATS